MRTFQRWTLWMSTTIAALLPGHGSKNQEKLYSFLSLIHDSSIYILYLTIMTFLNKLKFSLEMRCILFVFSSSSQLCLLVMKLHSLNSEIIKKNLACVCSHLKKKKDLTMTSARRPKKSIKTRTWILYIYFNSHLINRSIVRLMVYFGLK